VEQKKGKRLAPHSNEHSPRGKPKKGKLLRSAHGITNSGWKRGINAPSDQGGRREREIIKERKAQFVHEVVRSRRCDGRTDQMYIL